MSRPYGMYERKKYAIDAYLLLLLLLLLLFLLLVLLFQL